MRGVPIVGTGPGASPGTDPVQALLYKERQAENRGMNMLKSDADWARFRAKTGQGAHARRAFMDPIPATKKRGRRGKRHVAPNGRSF